MGSSVGQLTQPNRKELAMTTKPSTCRLGCAAMASIAFGVLCMSNAVAQTAAAPAHATPAEIVESLKFNAGNPPKARASFAKGQCVRGSYTPSPESAQVTKSLSPNFGPLIWP